MRPKRGPTLRAQWLGQQLRDLREEAGLTLKQVAEYVQRDASSISRLEAGIHPARVPDVLAYATLCRIQDARRRSALVKLAQDAWQTGWWDRYTEDALEKLMDLAWLEARAVEIWDFQALVLPGLLQSPEYARAVIRASDHDTSEENIDRWLSVRMSRQQILNRRTPARFAAVLDESVLHRQVGGIEVMRTQLEHLIKLTEQGNVTIQVLPWSSGAHASPEGCFEVLSMDGPFTAVGYAETPAGAFFLERDDVDRLKDRHMRLSLAALSQADSIGLIREIATEIETNQQEGTAQ
jgi:transcriptional regulator with XRE-family HTH domain